MRPQSLFMNSVWVRGIDGTSMEDLTRAQVGIRDTRRIVGEDYLSKEDCLELRKRPDDVILRCTGPFDNTTRGNDNHYVLNQIDMREWYDIPYGCAIPKGLDNVAVAGRTFSCHYMALTSSRGQALLIGLGQAVGTAAAMAVKEQKAFRDIDVKTLQKILMEDGCDLGIEG